MASYEALYGHKCRTPLYWTELSEKQIHGVDLVKETEGKVKSESCFRPTKVISDLKRKEIEFQVDDKVFLKVSPWKKILRFGRKGKLSLRFIGSYEITKRIGPVAYHLALPVELEKIHNVFHALSLRSFAYTTGYAYEEEPIKILAREVKQLRNKDIALLKVLWQRHGVEEATWEPEEAMREQYPNLFTGKIFEGENPSRGRVVTARFWG
ncbi:retrotransposon protein [Gossypium australe]|uniref:Retrotransposon protein n=1 Tax=Gossypium australe TaxID=47621 RepID=A0A5B6WNV3_9ROSI|nr:retrotransposon protein [Gossypium australe]